MDRQDSRQLISELRAQGIGREDVLATMARVPRDHFVEAGDRGLAWQNAPLSIGEGQTISQPFIVALMTATLLEGAPRRVLEIGTGSGYQAAILADLVDEVYSIERIEALYERSGARLAELGIDNVRLRHGDGAEGWPEAAPFDAMIITAGTAEMAEALTDQLAEGGVIVAPLEDQQGTQWLTRVTRRAGELHHERLEPVRFVPLRPGVDR